MPRLNTNQELFRQIDQVLIFKRVTAGGSTTATTAATAGAVVIDWASSTNFTAGDPLIISGTDFTELNSLATAGTAQATVTYKFGKNYAAGTSIYEAVSRDVGYVEESGVQLSPSFTRTAVRAANASLPIYYIPGEAEIAGSFSLLGFNGLNWQLAFGIPESEQGTGTSADPYQVALGGNDFGTEVISCIRVVGTRVDGATVHVDLNNVSVSSSGQVTFNRQAPAAIPVNFTCASMMLRHWS
jgi:hypothetical protein